MQAQPKKHDGAISKKISITPVHMEVTEYNAGKRHGPLIATPVALDFESVQHNAHTSNLIWSAVRLAHTSEQSVSSWTGFNIMTRDNVAVQKDIVGYLPTINAPATQLSTVYEILNQVLKIKNALHLEEIVCVFDQALYAKAAEITWKHLDMYKQIVLRMGVFHTLCNLISIIGKRFGSAGLHDLAVQSCIVAEGSITAVLGGRNYNRAVRLYKLVYEALLRLAWQAFHQWLEEQHPQDHCHMMPMTDAIRYLHDDLGSENLVGVKENPSVSCIFQRFSEYLEHLRLSHGSLAAFWMSFVDLVEILLGLIRASREGNWLLHLSSISAMIPWCFAYDKHNYANYLSMYYSQMSRLQETHPEIHQQMTLCN